MEPAPFPFVAQAHMLDGHQRYVADLVALAHTHTQKGYQSSQDAAAKNQGTLDALARSLNPQRLAQDLNEYLVDLGQRQVLFLDCLRKRGDLFLQHEEVGAQPVLAFAYETIVDGATLPRPVNYSLVRIIPPEGTLQRETGRPYIIIDPRAGHGSGIGGFKDESEVGCALRGGHPVYFVVFSRHPKPGQTLADVCTAEAAFVREVRRRHPQSPKPIIIGNCQGGWATMLLAATNPDITGPIVANGAPLSYWAGQSGKYPMRYLGGLCGGILPALILSDMGNGMFDGANLALNFEMLHPGRTWWTKHFDAFSAVDTDAERYLEFERWWGSFYYMSEAEIRWIIGELFIGNKLARGIAQLDERTHVDLRAIQSPIIVFASHGDNITPPQQALNWIADLYRGVDEIRVRGQRIIYTIHENVGHLGIFVSSEVAGKEHQTIVSTLKVIESLAPGLYEMVIKNETGEGIDKRYQVAFEERSVDDILALDDGRHDESAFATVARLSELGAELYELTMRPFWKALATPQSAQAAFALHPMRTQRYALSSRNPWLANVPAAAEHVRAQRSPAAPNNPFVQLERFGGELVTQWWNGVRDLNEFMVEWTFHFLYGSPAAHAIGAPRARRVSDAPLGDLRGLATVQDALDRIEEGGFPAGVIRMLILLARASGSVRKDRLERSNRMLETTEPFASISPKHKTRIVHRESLIVSFEADAALRTLPMLLSGVEERRRAIALCLDVAGPLDEMSEAVVAMFGRFAEVLEVESGVADTGSARLRPVA
jgi:pimeloyl-ACP methyl ester carboxylesterase